MTHKDLVNIAYKWVLKNASCGMAFKELTTLSSGEIPDVIGFGAWGHSVLVECKTSRSDFLADAKKPFRKNPEQGMGSQRFYLCPTGMIKIEDLPFGWGLIYVGEGGKAKCVHEARVPHDNPEYAARGIKNKYRFEKNIRAEHGMMYSALMRLHLRGRIDEIYQPLEQEIT